MTFAGQGCCRLGSRFFHAKCITEKLFEYLDVTSLFFGIFPAPRDIHGTLKMATIVPRKTKDGSVTGK
jgi:hypothetical protein